jgi:three-Cys-motif partner protein
MYSDTVFLICSSAVFGRSMSQMSFGGMHTEEKLQVLESYLAAYQKVLKNTGLTTIFFDAFAGTGEIPLEQAGGLLQDVEEAEPFIEGSARRALAVDPPFSRYVFVEKSKRKTAQLELLRAEFPYLAERIRVERADANAAIQEFCRSTDWKRSRAVLFLDPFGNQVGWDTLAIIARTKAIDVWYLFPAHLGINRQISSTADFDAAKAASLDFVFGTTEWREEFLATVKASDLWGEERERLVKQATVDSITRFMIGRMKQVFRGIVLDEWLPLGRGGNHWYSLLFACSNPSPAATRIAERVARAVMRRK